MELLNWVGHRIKIVYEDGHETVSTKQGTLTGVSDNELFIETQDKPVAIPRARIVRIELDER